MVERRQAVVLEDEKVAHRFAVRREVAIEVVGGVLVDEEEVLVAEAATFRQREVAVAGRRRPVDVVDDAAFWKHLQKKTTDCAERAHFAGISIEFVGTALKTDRVEG